MRGGEVRRGEGRRQRRGENMRKRKIQERTGERK